jgi:predicted RNase H-like HicB family nuclease
VTRGLGRPDGKGICAIARRGPVLATKGPGCGHSGVKESAREVEFIFVPQPEGGYHVYAPELPGLHTEGDSLDEATESAREALELYVEGLREDGRSVEMGIVRRKLPLPV